MLFSFVGFSSEKVNVKGSGKHLNVNVILKEDAQQLDDVVVVGYGTQKKVNMTGSVSTVKSEAIQGKASSSLAVALQGVTPGVTVISRPGDLGSDITQNNSINVRGRGNLGSSEPLFIIDGVPVSAGDFQRIPPGDVESISVLKDAAATAIYGARAAYGVFLVTTKKGKEGKASISYGGYYGFQTPTVLPDKLNAENFALLLNEANTNAGKPIVYSEEQLEKIRSGKYPDLYPDNDWYGLFYRSTAPMQEHNISLSGGGKTRYFVSGTLFQQESLVPGSNLYRYNLRANTERNFTDKFKLGTNISFVQEDLKQGGSYTTQNLDRMSPLSVYKHSDGSWGTVTGGKEDAVNAYNNPVRLVQEGGRRNAQQHRFIGTLNSEYKPLDNLTLTGMISYRLVTDRSSLFTTKLPQLTGWISKNNMTGTDRVENQLIKTWQYTTNLMAQFYATYNKDFDKHSTSLMVGTQYESYSFEWLRAGRKEYPSNNLETIRSGSEKAENLSNDGDISERKFFSQFGRFNYAYDSKYLFEANVRLDQSSQFHSSNRLGVFPSVSAAWRITQEDFMKSVKAISDLKLRLSWGQSGYVGNVGYYDYFSVLGIKSEYVTAGALADGVFPSNQFNKNFTWETVTTKNIGVDASFFGGMLSVQVDAFHKLAENILLKMPQPFELGLVTSQNIDERAATNAGVVLNKGIELSTSFQQNINDFRYTISGNMSRIWNKIVSLNGLDNQVQGRYIHKVGGAIGDFYGLSANGLFKDDDDVNSNAHVPGAGPGDIKYADLDGDKAITAKDRTVIGNDVPYFTYGLDFSANYKGFDLSIQGQGVEGVSVYLSEEASQAFFNGAGAKNYHLGRWTADNPDPNAVYPRLLPTADNNHNSYTSSFWLFDADYFRIKSIILGYTLPAEMTEHFGCKNLRFYISAMNLFTIRADKRMKDFDPEMASARGSYPNIKSVSFGVNISF